MAGIFGDLLVSATYHAGISIRDKHWGEVKVMDSKLDQTLERTSVLHDVSS